MSILAVGRKPPDWIRQGCAEYLERMPRDVVLTMVDIKPEIRGAKSREQLLAAEKERLLVALQGFRRIVVLDERGADLSTRAFAARLATWMRDGAPTALLIGSADGLDPTLQQQADETIRLSSLTLPHALVRVLLCEQIYRALSLLRNHPYHREG